MHANEDDEDEDEDEEKDTQPTERQIKLIKAI
jgi:hypothetical protein